MVSVAAVLFFFLNDTAPPEISPLSLHDALPIPHRGRGSRARLDIHPLVSSSGGKSRAAVLARAAAARSEEHTSELQSRLHLVCRLLLEKKNRRHTYVLRQFGQPTGPAYTSHATY